MCPAADPLWRRCLHAPWHLARQDAECAFEHVATSVLGRTLALTLTYFVREPDTSRDTTHEGSRGAEVAGDVSSARVSSRGGTRELAGTTAS
jgi:hypothetical protein